MKQDNHQGLLWIMFIILLIVLVNYNSSEHDSQDQASGYSSAGE